MNTGLFNGMFGKLASGMCRLSMNGEIAVKTSEGYKSYNVKTGRLTNCSSFVFDIGEDFFFIIPTSHVAIGDIILVGGKPKCVIEVGKNKITVINYEDSTVDTIVPQRHVFMGNTYFYGKIISMFGTGFMKGKKGMDKIMSFMMLKEMMRGSSGGSSEMSSILPFMMLSNGSMSNMFEGIFDFDELDTDFGEEEEEEDYTEVKKPARKAKSAVEVDE